MYKSTTFLLALVVVSYSAFAPYSTVTLAPNTIDFDYSPNQMYLAALTSGAANTLTLYNAYNLSPFG